MHNRAVFLIAVAAATLIAATSHATTWSGYINGPVTMTAADNPHIVTSTLTIPQGGELTIEPGASLFFHTGAAIEVTGGTLIADAVPSDPILMDWYNLTNPGGYGEWPGIRFGYGGSTGNSIVRNVRIYQAGISTGGAIWIDRTAPTIEGIEIRKSAGAGIVVDGTGGAQLTLSNVLVEDCLGNGIVVAGSGSTLVQTGSVVQQNEGNGIDLRAGGRVQINGLTSRDNSGYAIGMEPGTAILSLANFTVSGNGEPAGTKNAIGYRGGTIEGLETWTIYPNLPWHILATTTVATPNGFLTIPAGQKVYFAPGAFLDIAGRISASGTAAAPIRFTSLQDTVAETPPPAPVVTATGTSASALVTWTAVTGASTYEVYRRDTAAAAWSLRQTTAGTSFTDGGLPSLKTYLYKVLAVTSGGTKSADSNFDLATTIAFTDAPLPVGSTLKARYVVELRSAVNAICTFAGTATCPSQPFTGSALDENYVKTQAINAADFAALRSRIETYRAAVGATPAVFRETVTSGAIVKTIHVEDLRAGAN